MAALGQTALVVADCGQSNLGKSNVGQSIFVVLCCVWCLVFGVGVGVGVGVSVCVGVCFVVCLLFLVVVCCSLLWLTSQSRSTWHAHIARVLVCVDAFFFFENCALAAGCHPQGSVVGERWGTPHNSPNLPFSCDPLNTQQLAGASPA